MAPLGEGECLSTPVRASRILVFKDEPFHILGYASCGRLCGGRGADTPALAGMQSHGYEGAVSEQTSLRSLVSGELTQPVDPRVLATAEALAGEYPGAARAVLFYGSCLRHRDLEALMLDFYLIVSGYGAAYGRGWMAAANRLVPPNVFPFEHQGLIAKYAVLSEGDFARECSPQARSVSVWARFAQPSRLVWAKDEAARENVIGAVADAGRTLFALTQPMLASGSQNEPLEIYRKGFSLTYGAELRAEKAGKGGSLVDSESSRYARFGEAILAERVPLHSSPNWRRMQRKGKLLSLVRLAKASGTYAGGIDYLAWKINRHAGTEIKVAPWQRRWPLLGALILLPRLLKRGVIR
jgi:hypothetical protein